MTDISNYERSYKSMWSEIETARRKRDDALKIQDVARDLIIALRHDLGSGETRVSLATMTALNKLDSRLADATGEPNVRKSSNE